MFGQCQMNNQKVTVQILKINVVSRGHAHLGGFYPKTSKTAFSASRRSVGDCVYGKQKEKDT